MPPVQSLLVMSDFDAQEQRIEEILGSDDLTKTPKTARRYLDYLKANFEYPCEVTGREDFPWEERYVFGYGSEKEYTELRKTRPSYQDIYDLKGFEEMSPKQEEVLVRIRRKGDAKEFVMGLDWLKTTDEESKNHQLINDYAVWFVNY